MPIIIRVAVIRVVRRPSLSWVPACQCPAKSVSVPRATVQVTVTVVLTAGPYRQVTELRCRCTAAAAVPRAAGPGPGGHSRPALPSSLSGGLPLSFRLKPTVPTLPSRPGSAATGSPRPGTRCTTQCRGRQGTVQVTVVLRCKCPGHGASDRGKCK